MPSASDRGHQHLNRPGRDPEEDAAINALLETPAGLSTLDFIRRRPSSAAGSGGNAIQHASLSGLTKEDAERAVGSDFNRLGIRADAEEQRALIARLFEPPTTPVARKLVGGRLLRESELVETRDSKPSNLSLPLGASKSAPVLRRSVATASPSASVAVGKSEAETQARRRRCHNEANEQQTESGGAADARSELRRREELLQKELLHVTQKMCRKYSRRLAPVDRGSSATRSKTQDLAEQWTSTPTQQPGLDAGAEGELELDRRRHAAFVAGRFLTQSALDYYAREMEPREPGNNRHRRHQAHTKYGDALSRTRKSLRGAF